MPKLTVRGIEALRARPSSYKITVDRGLYLRVAPDGVKTWLVRYVIAGRQIQVRLPKPYSGTGESGHMSLAQAVTENARIQALAREGVNFQVQRAQAALADERAKSAARLANATFRELFETWLADGVGRKDGNSELRRTFEKDVLPAVGEKPVRDLGDADILGALRRVGRIRGRARTAERMLSELRQMFRWALKRQPWRSLLAQGNPAELVDVKQVVPQGYEPGIRQRTLSANEIRELRDIFETTKSAYERAEDKRTAERPLQYETQLALWICLGTACRIGELLQTRWKHVDLEKATWFVPRENTKTHVDWQVFLSDFALSQFKALHCLTGGADWCFPARLQEGPVFIKSVSKQVGDRQMRFKNRQPLSHRRNDDSLVLSSGISGEWTPHDLRRTAATMMQALGVNPDVIDRCQNHVLSGSKIRRHYLHHDYADEKREAWRMLGQRIDAILNSANVLPLQRAA